MIDFHSHILQGIDDGSKDDEMTVKMLRLAEESGTRGIVATPHFFKGRFQVPYNEVKIQVDSLKNLAKKNKIDIEIYYGQEIYYTNGIFDSFSCGDIGTIEDSRYMLIELPLKEFVIDEVVNDIYELQLKEIVPIIAHPERYKTFTNTPTLINKFIEEGFLFQLNTGSITGEFGREVKKTAELFVKHKIYSVLGSDAHRIENRNTNMSKGMQVIEKIEPGYIKEMKRLSEEILKDNVIKFQGNIVKKRNGIIDLFKK